MVRRVIAIALLVAGCSSSTRVAVESWPIPLPQTTCVEWLLDMSAGQQLWAAQRLFTEDAPNVQQADGNLVTGLCQEFPTKYPIDIATAMKAAR